MRRSGFRFSTAIPHHLRFYRGRGCEACGFTGFKGRTLLSEIFVMDKEAAKALGKGQRFMNCALAI